MNITITITAEEARIVAVQHPGDTAAHVIKSHVKMYVKTCKTRLVNEHRSSGDTSAEVSAALAWKESQGG